MMKNHKSYAHNQASSFGLGNQKTTTEGVSTLSFCLKKIGF
jgi:hypothetical protein